MHQNNRLVWAMFGLAVVIVMSVGVARRQPQPLLPTARLQIHGAALVVELATTPAQQARGLMFRPSLAPDFGMLFVFPEAQPLSFWMKNTSIPLSLAFLDDAGQVLSLVDMQPQDRTWHDSPGPARYALEVNAGWFQAHDIQVGDVVQMEGGKTLAAVR